MPIRQNTSYCLFPTFPTLTHYLTRGCSQISQTATSIVYKESHLKSLFKAGCSPILSQSSHLLLAALTNMIDHAPLLCLLYLNFSRTFFRHNVHQLTSLQVKIMSVLQSPLFLANCFYLPSMLNFVGVSLLLTLFLLLKEQKWCLSHDLKYRHTDQF